MSNKDAPPLTIAQQQMETFCKDQLEKQGVTVGWGRDKDGNYLSGYARDAWKAWSAAFAAGYSQCYNEIRELNND
jgi:hypothetical protein